MFGFKQKYPEQWKVITEENDLKDILMSSNEKPQVIFKNSPSCSVSFFAKKNLEALNNAIYDKIDLHVVNVIKQRPISQFIAIELSVRHESPQLIFLIDGEVKWHGSHSQVNANAVNQLLSSH